MNTLMPITKGSLGMFGNDIAAAADYVGGDEGLCEKQLINYVKRGYAPERYAARFRWMAKLAVFPIDEPFQPEVIGRIAYRALTALRHGDAELAEALAERALHAGARDWATGARLQLPPLQIFFARLAHGMAWSQHPRVSEVPSGLPALRRLRSDVLAYVKVNRIDEGHEHWRAWMYLQGMTTAYALGYYVGKIGLGWFTKTEGQGTRQRDPDGRRVAAKRIVRKTQGLDGFGPIFRRQHVATRAAWNMAQLAGVAQCESTFIKCLDVLRDNYRKEFPMVLEALRDDSDTGPMLLRPRIAAFVARLHEPRKSPPSQENPS